VSVYLLTQGPCHGLRQPSALSRFSASRPAIALCQSFPDRLPIIQRAMLRIQTFRANANADRFQVQSNIKVDSEGSHDIFSV
jgi:hypothetical protein